MPKIVYEYLLGFTKLWSFKGRLDYHARSRTQIKIALAYLGDLLTDKDHVYLPTWSTESPKGKSTTHKHNESAYRLVTFWLLVVSYRDGKSCYTGQLDHNFLHSALHTVTKGTIYFFFTGKRLHCHSLTPFGQTRYIFFFPSIYFFFRTHSISFVGSGIFFSQHIFFPRIIGHSMSVSFFL